MRNISRTKYTVVFGITLVIFILGLTLGMLMGSYKLDYIEKLYRNQVADYESLDFQYLYINSFSGADLNETCKVIEATLENNLVILGSSLEKIAAYETTGDINNEDYLLIKRRYTIANMRYWMLAEKNRQICGKDSVSIFYFYSKDCSICPDQGFILTQIKYLFADKFLVFPIDTNLDEPIISVLKSRYEVEDYPTIVIGDQVYRKFMTKGEIMGIICRMYKEYYEECRGYE